MAALVTTLKATGQDRFHNYFFPFTEGFDYAVANDIDDVRRKADDMTCAIMMELVQGEGGVLPLDQEFVKQVEALCREKDMLLIIDEVQTGIGRTGQPVLRSSSTASVRMLSPWRRVSAAVFRSALCSRRIPAAAF
ncbi:MAG: aminotransferase class III-fold pyridoxal phosphate-dependent enzyme [Butyricicoccaceae bacterium]